MNEHGKSAWVRKGKTAHVYSQNYQRWHAAAVAGNDAAQREFAEKHAKQFGYTRNVKERKDEC